MRGAGYGKSSKQALFSFRWEMWGGVGEECLCYGLFLVKNQRDGGDVYLILCIYL